MTPPTESDTNNNKKDGCKKVKWRERVIGRQGAMRSSKLSINCNFIQRLEERISLLSKKEKLCNSLFFSAKLCFGFGRQMAIRASIRGTFRRETKPVAKGRHLCFPLPLLNECFVAVTMDPITE